MTGPDPGPGAGTGGRVERTGIALVHEGEHIVPAAGSAARISADAGTVVHYHFPVEIEVVGEVDDAVAERIAEKVFADLDREMAARR